MKTIEFSRGRINLIGEHTDYNQGWVLPLLISKKTTVTLQTRQDEMINFESSEKGKFQYDLGDEEKKNDWRDYIQGVTNYLLQNEYKIKGANISVESTIPEGAGLSSSAALIITLLKCFRKAFSLNMNDHELALAGQSIEVNFVGANVGIMDQMAIIFGDEKKALFLDTMGLEFELVNLPSEMEVIIIHSGTSHKLASKEGYNQRRQECEEIKSILNLQSLRMAKMKDLNSEKLSEKLIKRAKHIITENERVHFFVKALKDENFEELGKLLKESHLSLRNYYEVSTKEIDTLTAIANSYAEVYGSRLTGGGFGGAIIVLTKKGHDKKLSENIIKEYRNKTGKEGYVIN